MYKKIKIKVSDELANTLKRIKAGNDTITFPCDKNELMSLWYTVDGQSMHVIDSITKQGLVLFNSCIHKMTISKNAITFIHGGFKTVKGRKLFTILDSLDFYEKEVTLDVNDLLEKMNYSIDYYSSNMALVRRDILEPAIKDLKNNGYIVEYEINKEGTKRSITFSYVA